MTQINNNSEKDLEQSQEKKPNKSEEVWKNIKSSVEKILVQELSIIYQIIDNIISQLKIENRLIKIKISYYLEKYINNKTYFYYDKNNKNIIWIALNEVELKELISKLYELILSDKRLTIKWWIEERKKYNYENLNKRTTQRNEILKKIDTLKQDLYLVQSTLYIHQDNWFETLTLEKDISIIQNNIKAEEGKIIELDEAILNIESILSFLNEKITDSKKQELSFDIEKYSKLLDFNISDYIPEKKPWILMGCEKEAFSNILKKWKKIIYPLSVLVWLGLFIKVANNIPEENKITPYNSQSINTSIPENILEDANKWILREVSGFEKYFIIWTDTYPINVIYKGNTLDEDIILSTIKLTFLDLNWIKRPPIMLRTYIYRKDINIWIKIIIHDASAEGQTINLSIRK